MKDITGQRFGQLVAIKPMKKNKKGILVWLCRCDCGKTTVTLGSDLRNAHTKSCGHLFSEAYRKMWGEKSPRHKLTSEQVNDIRHTYAAGFVTQRELAEKFKVTFGNISKIVRGVNWKNLPGGPITRMSPVTRAPRIRQARRIKQRNEGVSMSKK